MRVESPRPLMSWRAWTVVWWRWAIRHRLSPRRRTTPSVPVSPGTGAGVVPVGSGSPGAIGAGAPPAGSEGADVGADGEPVGAGAGPAGSAGAGVAAAGACVTVRV